MLTDRNTSVLSRSGPAAAVIGVHVLIAYVLSVSMGVVDVPKFAAPIEAIFIPEDKRVIPEPEIPVVKPEIADVVQPVDEPMPQIEFEESVVPPADVPMEPSANAISATASASGAPAQDLKTNKRVEPAYPPQSRRAGEEGSVLVRILVDERGVPRDVQVAKSSGFPRLDQAAMEAVRKWRFVAATNGSQAITAWTQVAITFRLTQGQG